MLKALLIILIFYSSPVFASGIVISVKGQASGEITIDLFEDTAPQHVKQIITLVDDGSYNGIAFHRVIDGFMAQTGDVQYGNISGDLKRAGMGGSDLPDLKAEFSDINYDRGIVGMARAQDPNSANSQFFIMFSEGSFLNGQYTVIGKVVKGLDVLDMIKKGDGQSGSISGDPDFMENVSSFK
ncbi:MAG: peptidylprolyl isomerase [Rhodobacteraceae bacterium]|nr:peptidylprolyl isomerase [Paracoccaceae bacterium]MDC0329125.1 peptidylprolyl isomerase [bacterium]